MSIFTFHLAEVSWISAFKTLSNPPKADDVPGLIHMECMTSMTLGSGVFSPSRVLIRQMAVFAQWDSESFLDEFLKKDHLGKKLAKGWDIRLQYVRQWGKINGFVIPPEPSETIEPYAPVVAVTIARMKLFQMPRFIRWGRPVEKLVRDHPEAAMALAAIRLPRTVSTFTVWNSQQAMQDMVQGHSAVPLPARHADAMAERDRKDFHFQFITLRFKPIAEYGEWKGRSQIIPNFHNRQL
ncbi:hypothetical protein [Algoriphagus sp. NG3]|uniref:hypothetical protein n=1 Tax=Algoriphagus sp. NG3 TaxID=3097546 RepID=UPI002A837280|nr:hypothetical protein [Algoriphagus sp. NG3]WPR77734.1 hypothetical protein SLW71_10300 [Algoriphagus sp. NG3]